MEPVQLVVTNPVRVIAVIRREAVTELDLRTGLPAVEIVTSTFVMLER